MARPISGGRQERLTGFLRGGKNPFSSLGFSRYRFSTPEGDSLLCSECQCRKDFSISFLISFDQSFLDGIENQLRSFVQAQGFHHVGAVDGDGVYADVE